MDGHRPNCLKTHWVVILSLFTLVGHNLTAQRANSENSISLLTSALEIRKLSPEEAAKHLPVHIKGVVIGIAEIGGEGYAIHDGTAGIYIQGPSNEVAQLTQGDYVEVTGVTDPGEFAPFVIQSSLKKLGKGKIPQPFEASFDEIVSGKTDAQWISVTGIVRQCGPNPLNTNTAQIIIATGGGRLTVRFNAPLPSQRLVDAKIRVKGVCYYNVNKFRQVINPVLSVPPEEALEILEPAPKDPFQIPPRPINSLLQFAAGGSYGHMVHVTGVVTCVQRREFWVRDHTRGLHVLPTDDATSLQPGDFVNVIGFPKNGEYSPVLEDAAFRKIGKAPSPPAHLVNDLAQIFDHDADLVTLEATLLNLQLTKDGIALGLRSGDQLFRAVLPTANAIAIPKAWQPGSRVKITGICNVTSDPAPTFTGLWRPKSFQIVLSSTRDLAIIKPPPFFTQKRILWLLLVVSGLSTLAIAIVWIRAQMRVKEQLLNRALAEAQFSAILNERDRIARELHDILAQGLNAILLNLDLVRDELNKLSDRGAKHLQIAYELARRAAADARNAVWNMRPQVLEQGDLPTALEGILEQMTAATPIKTTFLVTGPQRRLPPIIENALLRIGQEAITNAVKHAKPSRIEVRLAYDTRTINLTVEDDGCGFEPEVAKRSNKAFGLKGIKNRVSELHGELVVTSRPGEGTIISVTVPIPPPAEHYEQKALI